MPITVTPVSVEQDPDGDRIIDALSGRGDLGATLTGLDDDVVYALGALARLFNPTS